MKRGSFLKTYGPWAVVTGASEGIGRAFAEQLGAMGFHLVLVARRAERLEELAARLRSLHKVETMVLAADLSTADGVNAVDQCAAKLDVGLLVAAAGYGTSGPILQADLEQELDMLRVNCFAVLGQCVRFGKRFAARGGGGIVLMSSLLAWQGVPRAAHYAATKAYVQSLAEGLRLELLPAGVDVLASAPGPVSSGFADRADMRMSMAETPGSVAKASLRALGRQGTVIPGGLSKLLTRSLMLLPRALRSRILAQVMAGMTQHQATAAS